MTIPTVHEALTEASSLLGYYKGIGLCESQALYLSSDYMMRRLFAKHENLMAEVLK